MKPRLTRRQLLQRTLTAAPALALAPGLLSETLPRSPERHIASGPFQPNWPSLRAYRTPEWFRDAKFGIWAHWSAQCVPEQGDWYARRMYIQGDAAYDHHLKTYGHPSKTGFMEIENLWKAELWKPEQLMDLYVAAGAKYFMALACHHDNLDTFNSKHHAWNTTRVGPKKDIVGTWAKIARDRGLRFGVSDHASHAWHWYQVAYDYDPTGPLAGVRYDAYRLTKADGRGKWWEGLDPQELYTGPSQGLVMPDGVSSIAAADAFHKSHDMVWNEAPPPDKPDFTDTWFFRCQDLMDSYTPDLIYFDDSDLPLGQAGLDATAHIYNSSIARNGSQQTVVFAKKLQPDHLGAVTLDIERGRSNEILAEPWQTDTCIGDWHYKRSIFENHTYKTPTTVIRMLIDIISKNGNLLLSIPVRGDGSLDEDEHAFLKELAAWMPVHAEAIYGTRPYKVFGEGPPEVIDNSNFHEKQRAYTSEDIRFTCKGKTVYAFALGWPADEGKRNQLVLKTFAKGAQYAPSDVHRVRLLGVDGNLHFTRSNGALTVDLPSARPNPYAWVLRIET